MRLSVGAQIELGYGRVVVEEKLGEGAMGAVFRGWLFYAPHGPRAKEPPVPLAVKALLPHAVVQEPIRRLFLAEADALRRLSHPNVVQFHGLFDHGGTLVLAMELVVGDTLEDVIARHVARARLAGPGAIPGMPFPRAWSYFQQLLGALAATHAIHVVHRDVKPSNVLVRRDGVVKLTDFGIAHLVGTPDPAAARGSSYLAPGTGAYMSPEQVLSRPLDGRSDLYSAGIVFYEMLSGRLPFPIEGRTELLVRLAQVEAPPPPIRTWLAHAPPVLDSLFARAIAKDPQHRFGSAIEMGEAFRTALGLPDTALWRAQAEIASVARTTPQWGGDAMQTLRDFVAKGNSTLQM